MNRLGTLHTVTSVRNRLWRRGAVAIAAAALVACGGGVVQPAGAAHRLRVGAWAGPVTAEGPAFSAQTVRMVVHSNVTGSAVRLHLSNRYGSAPLVLGHLDVALRAGIIGGEAFPGSHRTVTFSGDASATVPAGADLTSDPVDLPVGADQSLLVSVYLPVPTGPSSFHSYAADTSWTTSPGGGDHAADDTTAAYTRTTASWYFLDAVDVLPDQARDTVVAFGDSITDGTASLTGTNTRWPDDLARRLEDFPAGQRHAVVDAGIGGNKVLTDGVRPVFGVSALKRFGADALDEPGVRTVILLEGINDIGDNAGPGGGPITAEDLIAGYRALISEAHARHVRILGGTLVPFQGAAYYTPGGEFIRESVNHWIQTSGAFDGVVDFARAIADPDDPLRLAPEYDSGDHLHPNSAGYQAMANAVDPRAIGG